MANLLTNILGDKKDLKARQASLNRDVAKKLAG
jgi:hypothetical protein